MDSPRTLVSVYTSPIPRCATHAGSGRAAAMSKGSPPPYLLDCDNVEADLPTTPTLLEFIMSSASFTEPAPTPCPASATGGEHGSSSTSGMPAVVPANAAMGEGGGEGTVAAFVLQLSLTSRSPPCTMQPPPSPSAPLCPPLPLWSCL